MRDVLSGSVVQQAAAKASVNSNNLTSPGDLQRLVKVAVELRKSAHALAQCELLNDLGDVQLAMMASAGVHRKKKKYAVLYREGAPATCFFLLRSGAVQEKSSAENGGINRVLSKPYYKPEMPYVLIGTEALFGKARSSTVEALENCELLRFEAHDLNIKSEGAARVARKVFDLFVINELQCTPAFATCRPRQLRR